MTIMTAPMRQVHLRWSTHQGTVLSNFDALLKSESFIDVTLTTEGKQLKAHKMLLSACSPYFEEIFKQMEDDKYPIIFLKDVKFAELQALVHFMYHGEVKISQENLPSLLSVAKSLRVRGLSSDQPSPPVSNAKTIPLQALINGDVSDNTHKSTSNNFIIPKSSVVTTPTTFIPKNSQNFRKYTNIPTMGETPITIVNCSSLAPKFSTNQTSTWKPTPANSAPVSSLVRIPVLEFPSGSSPPQERFIIAAPLNASNANVCHTPVFMPPKRQVRTVTSSSNDMFKTRPIILGNKNNVTTLVTSPVRKDDDDPPILFPEVELSDTKPRFEFVKPKLLTEIIELEEEEAEMMKNEDSETVSSQNLSESDWTYVQPDKLADMAFNPEPTESAAPSCLQHSRNLVNLRRMARLRNRRYHLQQGSSIYGQKKGLHQCKFCFKLYQRKGSLVRHEKYECNKPPQFQCDYCGVSMRHTFHKTIHEKSCSRRHRSRRTFVRP